MDNAKIIRDCQCERKGCEPHGASDLEPVATIYGTFHICGECRTAHPIPADFLTPVGA
jgi:hypothetical protein